MGFAILAAGVALLASSLTLREPTFLKSLPSIVFILSGVAALVLARRVRKTWDAGAQAPKDAA
jgi:hypothetical protein